MPLNLHIRSRKVRRELWSGLVASSLFAVGVLSFNAYTEEPLDSVFVGSGLHTNKIAVETVPTTTAKSLPKPSTASVLRDNDVYSHTAGLAYSTSFASLMVNTGLSSMLKTAGPFSLFVPTNAALRSANTGDMTAADRKRFAQYHIISGRAVDVNAVTAGNVTTLSGDPLNFVVIGETKIERVNSSRIIETIQAGNGIIYIIDAPLFPPHKPRI